MRNVIDRGELGWIDVKRTGEREKYNRRENKCMGLGICFARTRRMAE